MKVELEVAVGVVLALVIEDAAPAGSEEDVERLAVARPPLMWSSMQISL